MADRTKRARANKMTENAKTTDKGQMTLSLAGKYISLQAVLHVKDITRARVAECMGATEDKLANIFYGKDDFTVKEAQDIIAFLKAQGVHPAVGFTFYDLFFGENASRFYGDWQSYLDLGKYMIAE